ncbi:TolC family protein [Hyphomonas sp. NPDC076900]|uniref:TolC family protein n=1 Tax=unclassified Hyphomonas TaxID=2630699 RepID=UPI003CFC6404
MKTLRQRRVLGPGLLLLTVSACASVQPDAGFPDISKVVEARTGAAPVWTRSQASRAEADAAADRLLEERVGMDEAVAVAFLTSPRLQAELEVLGIARADLISSVLPPAPFLEVSRPASGNTLSLDVSASLLDLIFWPQRARAGKAAMEAAQARAAAALADAAADVRIAFIEHIAAVQALDLYRQAEAAGQAAQLAAEAMFEAGNIARVDYDRQRQFAAQMTAERMGAEAQVGPTRERLIARLGLTQERAEKLQLVSRLPAPAEAALDTGRLIGATMNDSLQVAAAEADMRQVAAGRGLRNIEALIGDAEFGAEFERDGSWSDESYSLGLALPVDLGVAGRQRVASEMRQALQTLYQARLDSLAEIRSSAQTAESARALALFHREVSLPVSADVFDGVVRDFNAMQIGMFELLQSRRDRVDAGRDYLDAVTDYWRARAELERHVRVGDFESGAVPGNGEEHPQSDDNPAEDSPADHHQHQGHDHG